MKRWLSKIHLLFKSKQQFICHCRRVFYQIVIWLKYIIAFKWQVGFRSVEEKKSLEILLKERPLDKTKLKQFCLRFTVPAMYRNFLWKVLLDVIPVYSESQGFIMAQRKAEFQDLQRALRVAKIIDDFTKPHLIFLAMWLLRKRRAKVDMAAQLESPLYRFTLQYSILSISNF